MLVFFAECLPPTDARMSPGCRLISPISSLPTSSARLSSSPCRRTDFPDFDTRDNEHRDTNILPGMSHFVSGRTQTKDLRGASLSIRRPHDAGSGKSSPRRGGSNLRIQKFQGSTQSGRKRCPPAVPGLDRLFPAKRAETAFEIRRRTFEGLENGKKFEVSNLAGAILDKTENVAGSVPSLPLKARDNLGLCQFLRFTQRTQHRSQQVPMPGGQIGESDPRRHPSAYTRITLTMRLYMYYLPENRRIFAEMVL